MANSNMNKNCNPHPKVTIIKFPDKRLRGSNLTVIFETTQPLLIYQQIGVKMIKIAVRTCVDISLFRISGANIRMRYMVCTNRTTFRELSESQNVKEGVRF